MRKAEGFSLVFLVLIGSFAGFRVVIPNANCDAEGWQVDVYTQKDPYNGIGFGQPSDSFESQETVFLHAYLTYNMAPVQHADVYFRVFGPANPIENLTASLSALTDESGTANANFTIPRPPVDAETITFGTWTAIAYIPENASDSVTFKVGYTVELVELRVVDEDPPRGGWLDVEVSIGSIAMTPKNGTLALTLFDSLNGVVGFLMESFATDANGTIVNRTFVIPKSAGVGPSIVNASLLAPSGAPYGPSRSVSFVISLLGDLNFDNRVNVVDVAIVSAAFGSYPGHSRWDPRADIDKDNSIGVRDVSVVARHFGDTHP
ncbi:hypothetical protein MUP01_02050 [Candidatus Bathyarchaeota archaeon]|nr:hypothetical protein [Candidatus Bathyarchaeota archaeon]